MPVFGIVANPYKEIVKSELPQILRSLKARDISLVCSQSIFTRTHEKFPECEICPDEEIPAKCDMILTFGGDGTILRTIQMVGKTETPVLGINVGGLGFLTAVLLEDFESHFDAVLEGNYEVEDRLILEGNFEGEAKPLYALNEMTIEKGRSTRLIEVQVDIDDRYFNNYVADGLIISTPTGSTGYSLSSGGPIVVPASECIILNPICPHSLTNRPVIIPAASKISANLYTDQPEIIISADSQDVREVPSRSHLELKRAPFNAKLVKLFGSDYFTLLRNKLSWGGDFRNKSRWLYNR
jgi:NAD+ kinase